MKLKLIHRTSTIAWSPASAVPTLATGTVAGALDESFSNDSRLEIWSPNFVDRDEYDLGAEGGSQNPHCITTSSRFNRLAWGAVDASRPQGVIASGMENGEIGLWDPAKIVAQADAAEASIFKNKAHDGPVRGLDFNPIAKNLLASGATNGQLFIWDLKDPSSPYSPGGRSSRLDEITALSWNTGVQQILASSSSTGFTVVWDLRGKREVVALSYAAGGGPMQGSRRGQSAVAWHPGNSTRLVTASEDDASPIIMLWDLRNARAPEKILNGHDKGILSLSWCKEDPDLLLSCGKDSRTLAWNPQSGEVIGELPIASNWAYQVEWCPRDPDILATASFDGSIGIHSIQSTNQEEGAPPTPSATDDVFAPSYHQNFETTLSLKQPPKWLKRPVGGVFGYGGVFVSISNLAGATGQHQSGVVHLHSIKSEASIVSRANALAEASKDASALTTFAEKQTKESATNAEDEVSWRALASLFKTGSRDELIALLGFSKEKVAARVAEAIKNLQGSTPTATTSALPAVKAEEEPASIPEPEVTIKTEPEEPSLYSSESSEAGDSTTSLFASTPQGDAEADFFSSMGGIPSALPAHMQVPHKDHKGESSAAATHGSPTPSNAPSEIIKRDTFRIYPDGESDIDRLVTQALVLGDFAAGVELCLSAERYADAILLAVRGGPELLKKTQKAYFEKSTTELPYLRLYQSVVGNDLADVVQNADLKDWQEVFVILCTYAIQDEFAGLTEQLGQRLEYQSTLVKTSGTDDVDAKARTLRKNATLCYLAAGNLEKVVNIWVEEMAEEQEAYAAHPDQAPKGASRYTAHAQALQTFVEKVTVFRGAVKYTDIDLENPTTSNAVAESGARTYKLATLYDRYMEYADLLATQGLLELAATYVMLTPKDYNGGEGIDAPFRFGRERLLVAAGKQHVPTSSASAPIAPASTTASKGPPAAPAIAKSTAARLTGAAPYANPYTTPSYPAATPSAPTSYGGYSQPVNNGYAHPGAGGYPPYGGQQPLYGQSSHINPGPMIPAPPPAVNTGYTPPGSSAPTPINTAPPPPIPAALRSNLQGWNDPPMAPSRRTPVPAAAPAITNPLPNSPPIQNQPSYGQMPGPTGTAPPPRTGSAGIYPPRAGVAPPPPPGRAPPHAAVPPPPRAGSIPPSTLVPHPQPGPYGSRPSSVGPPPNPYDARPPSTDTPSMGRYAPPRTDSITSPGGVPPPPPKQEYGPPPPMRGSGPYAPPPGAVSTPQGNLAPPPPRAGGAPPVIRSGTGGGGSYAPPPPSQATPAPPPPAPAPAKPVGPKYPPGDRSHMPESVKGIWQILAAELDNFKKITPKRTGDDVERRLNVLFDSLNCATLSIPVVQQLLEIIDAFQQRNPGAALQVHLQMLTEGSRGGDDITVWMPALKQLCQRMLG